MSRHITEKVCFEQGHRMVTLDASKVIAKVGEREVILDGQKEILCERCGLSQKQIQHYQRHQPGHVARKPKKDPDNGEQRDDAVRGSAT